MRKGKTLYIYRYDQLDKVLKDISSPQNPKEFLYGMDKLLADHNISYINVERGIRDTLLRKGCYLIEAPFARAVKLGMPVEIYLENRKLVRSSDTIICVNDPISLGILFYKMLHGIDGRVFVLFHSLPERLKYFRNRKFVIAFIAKLLSHADHVLTLSTYAQTPLIDTFRVPQEKLRTFYFGVDTDYWKPGEGKRREFILSVGNDMNRDYATLINAVPENMDLVIVTAKKLDMKGKNNVKVISGIPDSELRELYQTCKVAVIPSITVEYESPGLSCTLQAMACRTPVLISDSPCIREYFTESEHIHYYEPENPLSLRDKLLGMIANYKESLRIAENGYKLVGERFTTQNMAATWRSLLDS